MIITATLGHGWHLTCPDCRAVLTPPRGAPLPHPDCLRALACPLCEDARELAQDLAHHHRRAEALINALPSVDWDSDAKTCAELDAHATHRRRLAPKTSPKLSSTVGENSS